TPLPTFAQDAPGDVGGFTRFGSYSTLLPFEHLDAQDGRVILRFTDLVLPGNRGRDLRVERTLNAYGFWSWSIAGIPPEVQDGLYNAGYSTQQTFEAVLFTYGPKVITHEGGIRQMYF